MGYTLAEKLWNSHVVHSAVGEPDVLYIDMHLVHEVTSPQAFDGLRLANRRVRRPDLTIATEDHNVPTTDIDQPIADPVSRTQVDTLRRNCAEFGIRLYPMGDASQGIVHVIGPQLGLLFPVGGMQGYLNLKAYGEFSGSDRPTGWNAWLTLSISPLAAAPPASARPIITK